jgi:hypothetical protein
MRRKYYPAYKMIPLLVILLASIFFINSTQFLTAQNNGNNTNIIDKRVAQPQDNQSDLTAIFDSLMNPKVLLGSAIDQIRNSAAKTINSNNEKAVGNATIYIINPRTLLFSHQLIPPKDFILVYDAMPFKIIRGQVYAKLPCDSNSKSPLQIRVAALSEVKPVQLQLVSGLSKPGYMCMYNADLTSANNNTVSTTKNPASEESNMTSIMTFGGGEGSLTIIAIELFNPTTSPLTLPSSASLALSLELAHQNLKEKRD